MQDFWSLTRGAVATLTGIGVPRAPEVNNQGDTIVAQNLPERASLVAQGNSYSAQLKEGNAWTALITIPTTLSNFSLQNGELAGGKSYIIDRIWLKAVTSLAAANYLVMLVQVVFPGTALVADSANKTTTSLSGKVNYGGKAQIAVASTSTGCLTDKWECVGGLSLPTSTTIAAAYDANVYGRYIIPPQGSFNMNAQEAVSGGTLICGVEWHEVQLYLG